MTDTERSLKPYWYPMEDGEKNEVVPSLQKNVVRPTLSTKLVDFIVKLVMLSIVSLVTYISFKQVYNLYDTTSSIFSPTNHIALIVSIGVVVVLIIAISYYFATMENPCYLVDFAITIPPEELSVSNQQFIDIMGRNDIINKTSLEFLDRLQKRTGIGEHSCVPEAYHKVPLQLTMKQQRKETEQGFRPSCDALFKSTGIDPTKDIDFVITNCSMFNPTPSMSAMIMNAYKIKQSCKNYTLGGMGCSAGLLAVDLANDLLQAYPNSNVLIFSTENIIGGFYPGKDKGRLLANTLFRMGGCCCIIRTNHQKYDDSYQAIYQSEDSEGIVGVKIGRELLKCVTRSLIQNLNTLMPKVMSWKEIFNFAYDYCLKALGKRDKKEQFTPNFKETFQGFCIHSGGRAIIDGLQEHLKLTDEDCMPSRAALYRFGNTSSASVWYELMFLQRVHALIKGDRVWQIAFGSGLKCNSCVWEKLN
ncbi:3-ketoacyl-CoA synthase [Entamoeba marina]